MQNSLDENAPVKLVTKTNVSGHAKIRQLWKIRYLREGYYCIRSLYKADRCVKVTSNAAKLDIVATSDHISCFNDNALWKIESLGTGYTLQNCGVTTNKQCLCPSGTSVVTSMFVSGNSLFTWTLTPDTAVPDLMVLIDADTCLPVHGALKSVSLGQSATLEDLGLMVSFISQTSNTTNYYWQVSDSSIASITGSNNKVTALARGETTISLHASTSTNTPMYFTLHVPWVDNGTYYIRNWETDRYIEAADSGYVYGESFSPGSPQLWDITYVGNGEYTIQLNQVSNCYLGINGDTNSQGGLVMTKSADLTAGTRWTFTKMDSGAFRISAQCASGLYIRPLASDSPYIRQYAPEDSGSQYSEWLFCEYSNQVAHEMQEENMWCWVTCARMASFMFMKSPISQEAAAYYMAFYTIMDQYELPLTLYPQLSEGNPALSGGSAAQTAKALEYILGWEGCTYYNPEGTYAYYMEYDLIELLDAGNVVIVGRQSSSSSGHACLVYDYTFNEDIGEYQFYLYDPAQCGTNSTIVRTYDWMCRGQDAYYTEHKDNRVWLWLVTYRIGPYDEAIVYD